MLTLALVIVDQLSKFLVISCKPRFKLIPRMLEVIYTENTGTVFGVASNHNFVFIFLSFAVLLGIVFVFFKKSLNHGKQKILWQLIIAGGIGNLLDRIIRGFVVDFLYIKPFGICNLADIFIVSGVVLLITIELVSVLKERNNVIGGNDESKGRK